MIESVRQSNFRMKVRKYDRERRMADYRAAASAVHWPQVDWEATLKGTEQLKSALELVESLSKRAVGMLAFKRKYYSVLFDEVRTNAAGYLRHAAVAEKWEKVFNGLEGFGKVLKYIGLPIEGVRLSWQDLSAKGISANTMTMVSRWAVKDTLSPMLDTLHRELAVVKRGSDLVAWGAGRLGFKETEGDIKIFSIQLEGTINETDQIVDKILSVDSARDVLTWDRSVINPNNWSLLKDEVKGQFSDVAAEAQPLLDRVAHALGRR